MERAGQRAAMATVRSQRETPSGLLRVNAPAQGVRALAPLVVTFLRPYPELRVDLLTKGRLVDGVAAGLDLGLRRSALAI